MSPPAPLPPVPPGMDAEVLHDGAAWRFGPGRRRMLGALVGVGAAGLLLAGWGLAGGGGAVALLALLPAVALALVGSRITLRTEARLTGRHLVVDVERLLQRERRTVRLDEIDLVKLSDPPEHGGTGQVVVRSDHEIVAFGRDEPREHNRWFVDAIGTAAATVARREAREGREYSFMRVAPEEVEALSQKSSD